MSPPSCRTSSRRPPLVCPPALSRTSAPTASWRSCSGRSGAPWRGAEGVAWSMSAAAAIVVPVGVASALRGMVSPAAAWRVTSFPFGSKRSRRAGRTDSAWPPIPAGPSSHARAFVCILRRHSRRRVGVPARSPPEDAGAQGDRIARPILRPSCRCHTEVAASLPP